jgi:hypothetical protein
LAINSMLRSFWWGSKDGNRKPCWVSWETMCSPKFPGVMGFRDIELFNLAMLARQAWRILQNPEALSSRILKAVYFPNTDFLEASLGSSPSHVWRAIVEGKETMKQGLIRRIGTGENTHAWNHNWLPRDFMLRPLACLKANPPLSVAFFINLDATWNVDRLKEFFLLWMWRQSALFPCAPSGWMTFGPGTMRRVESYQYAQFTVSWFKQRSGERIGWKAEQRVQALLRKVKPGRVYGKYRCPPSCVSSSGDSRNSHCLRAMLDATVRWRRRPLAPSVGRRTRGATP